MKTFNPTLSILSGVALATSGMVLGAAPPASADVLWDWSYSLFGGGNPNIAGSGTFTTTDVRPDGSFLITGITGTSSGSTITSLAAPDVGGGDNLLFLVNPQLTNLGVAFNDSSPVETRIDSIYFRGAIGVPYEVGFGVFRQVNAAVDFTASQRNPLAVPESSSLLGCITLGGLMLGSTLRKAIN